MTTQLSKRMNLDEAEAWVGKIRNAYAEAAGTQSYVRSLALEFDTRKGWEAFRDTDSEPLYEDVEGCLRAKLRDLGMTQQRAHQLIAAAQVEQDVITTMVVRQESTSGPARGKVKDQIPTDKQGRPALNERILRPLTRLDSAKDRQDAMSKAILTAASRGVKINSTIMAQVVKAKLPKGELADPVTETVKRLLTKLDDICTVLNKMTGMADEVPQAVVVAMGKLETWNDAL